jgi:hypothetical protein
MCSNINHIDKDLVRTGHLPTIPGPMPGPGGGGPCRLLMGDEGVTGDATTTPTVPKTTATNDNVILILFKVCIDVVTIERAHKEIVFKAWQIDDAEER